MLFHPFLASRYPNKLAPNVPTNIVRNPPLFSIASSSISLFAITNVVIPEPRNFLWIFTSAANVVAVNPSEIKTLFATGLSRFFINGKPVFIIGPRSLSKNPSDCSVLDSLVFDSFILVDNFFAKALQNFETYLCEKLFSSSKSPITFDDSFRVTSAAFFIADFSILSCKFENFAFTLLDWVIFLMILY